MFSITAAEALTPSCGALGMVRWGGGTGRLKLETAGAQKFADVTNNQSSRIFF